MPAVLVVLPPEFVSDNPEISIILKKEALAFQTELSTELQPGKFKQKITKGAYKGAQIYEWGNDFTAIAHSSFIVPPGVPQKKEIMRIASLIRLQDCVHLGSRWTIVSPLKEVAIENKNGSLKDFSQRSLKQSNTIRFDTKFTGIWGERGRTIFDAVFSETAASEGIPVNSSISRQACKWISKDVEFGKYVEEYPARAHRVVVTQILEEKKKQNKTDWPAVTMRTQSNSGIFGEKNIDLANQKEPKPFAPSPYIKELVLKITESLHLMTEEKFKVIKREGKWAYLNRGRAYGLKIGMHLISDKGATLHIIQFSNLKDEHDVAVALVRSEAKGEVKEGDLLSLDPTTYPLK